MINEEDRKRLADAGNPDRIRTIDDFMRLGRYCGLVLLVAELMTLASLANMIYMIYAGSAPRLISYGNTTLSSDLQGCHLYDKLRKEVPGQNREMDVQFYSVNVEFDLLCSDVKQVKTSISWQMAGVLFGALFAGCASDMYGRKKILLIALLGVAIFSLWVAKSSNLFWFTTSRFCVGLFTGAMTAVQGVFLMENIPKKHRVWINTVVTWSPNFIIFPFIAYLCHDWRTLSYFISGVTFASALGLLTLEESPRWKVSVGDIEGARRSLQRINRIDKVKDPEEHKHLENMLEYEKQVHEERMEDQGSHQLVRLVKSSKYLRYTATLCFGIIVVSILNYGLLFNMEKLSGSLYWNNVIFGILRWFMNISAGLADYVFDWFGRKMINSTAMAYTVPSLAIIIVIYQSNLTAEWGWLARYLTIGVTAMTSQLYLAKFIMTTELFPTSVRNVIASALSVSSRIAVIFTPQLFYLAEITPTLPYTVMCVLCCIDWILFQTMLPETKGSSLQNRIPDKKQKNILSRKQSIVEA